MHWILLVICLNIATEKDSPKISMQEFYSNDSCTKALIFIQENNPNMMGQKVITKCIEDSHG